jgi:hypothetical protein
VPTLGLAICAAVLGARRTPLVLLAGCAALVVEGYATLVHTGGNVNSLLPVYFVVAVFAGLAMGGRSALPLGSLIDRLRRVRNANSRPEPAGRWAAVVAGLVIVQVAALAAGFRPARAIPSDANLAVGLRLVAGVRTLGGTVAIPSDPGLALTAGLPAVEDGIAGADVMRASDQNAKTIFTGSIARAVAEQRFTAIISELRRDTWGFPADLRRYYRRCPQVLLVGVPPAPFLTGPGARGRPVSLWLPVGHGSCAAAARALDDGG